MLLSIVVPAFNEAGYLRETLANLNIAKELLQRETSNQAEIIVVDNDSNDSTADIARLLGATVGKEKLHNIAKVRNTGANLAKGDVIVFVDADTLVPANLLTHIVDAMDDNKCFGGAVGPDHRPRKLTVRAYLKFWRLIGNFIGMAQGATQFFRRDTFSTLGGYDETLFMGEDVDLYWRLKKLAKRRRGRTAFISDIRVVPSPRRFDQWSLWRTLLWTNPLLILMFRRSERCWKGWYRAAPR